MNAIVRGAVIGAAVGGIGASVRARQSGAAGPDVQSSALKGVAAGAVVGGGIGWWVKRRGVSRLAEAAQPVLEAAAEAASSAGEVARTRGGELAQAAAERAGDVAHSAGEVARSRGGDLAGAVRSRAASVAESARPVLSAAAERAGEVATTAGEVARAGAADAAARLAAPPAAQLVDASGAKTVQVPGDPDHPAPIFVSL